MDGEDWVQRQSLFGHRSDSKVGAFEPSFRC